MVVEYVQKGAFAHRADSRHVFINFYLDFSYVFRKCGEVCLLLLLAGAAGARLLCELRCLLLGVSLFQAGVLILDHLEPSVF